MTRSGNETIRILIDASTSIVILYTTAHWTRLFYSLITKPARLAVVMTVLPHALVFWWTWIVFTNTTVCTRFLFPSNPLVPGEIRVQKPLVIIISFLMVRKWVGTREVTMLIIAKSRNTWELWKRFFRKWSIIT